MIKRNKKLILFSYLLLCLIFLLTISGCAKSEDSWQSYRARYVELTKEKYQLELNLKKLQDENKRLDNDITNIENKLDNSNSNYDSTLERFSSLENEIIKGAVIVTHLEYQNNGIWIFDNNEVTSGALGSGFVISEDDTYYYILTNNHVIYSDGTTDLSKVFVYDYYMNKYEATLILNDKNYDMALLKITKGKTSLRVMELALSDPTLGDECIAIGQPKGQVNSVSFGNVLGYEYVNYNDESSSVSYKVIRHDAYMLSGNSGGMLLNSDFKVIGINTWGLKSDTYENHNGFASGITKIKTFLENGSFTIKGKE